MRALLVDDDRELARLLGDYLARTARRRRSRRGRQRTRSGSPRGGGRRVRRGAARRDAPRHERLRGLAAGFATGSTWPLVMLTARGEGHRPGRRPRDRCRTTTCRSPSTRGSSWRACARSCVGPSKAPASAAGAEDRVEVGDLVDRRAGAQPRDARRQGAPAHFVRVPRPRRRSRGAPVQTVTREELASVVLPKGGRYDPSGSTARSTMHVSHLRHKIGDDVKRVEAHPHGPLASGTCSWKPS